MMREGPLPYDPREPIPPPVTVNTACRSSGPKEDLAYAAMRELLARLRLQRVTGKAYVRLDVIQGLVASAQIVTEENFKQKS